MPSLLGRILGILTGHVKLSLLTDWGTEDRLILTPPIVILTGRHGCEWLRGVERENKTKTELRCAAEGKGAGVILFISPKKSIVPTDGTAPHGYGSSRLPFSIAPISSCHSTAVSQL